MALLIFARNFNKNTIRQLNYSAQRFCSSKSDAVEKSETVEYPPILDLSKKAKQIREKIAWHNEVKNLKTIEEKLIKVNMPYYYGLRTIPLNDEYHYDCLPYMQHWTRTQIENGLPNQWYQRPVEEIDGLVNSIRNQFMEAIAFQFNGYR